MNEKPTAFTSSFIVPPSSFSFHSFAVRLWCEQVSGRGARRAKSGRFGRGAGVGTGVASGFGDAHAYRAFERDGARKS